MPLPPTIRWKRISRAEAISRGLDYYFDQRKADHAVGFFENFLIHSKGQFAGQPFTLLPWQKTHIIEELFGWMKVDTDKRRYRIGYIEVPKKNGKALSVDTPVPTPSGWSTMGELAVGDEVFSADGSVCRIVAATPAMTNRECFEIEFSDGCRIVADADHEWLAHCHSEEKTRVFTTREMAGKQRFGSKANNFRIPVSGPLDCPHAELPIDPYLLGAWLGDGATMDARISVGPRESEMLDLLSSRGVSVTVKDYGRCYLARPRDGTQASLRRLGLIGRKHIPAAYLRSSREQRELMLRGLMDTDGFASKKGQCEYCTISRELCDGVVELIRSLGYKPTVIESDASINGKVVGRRFRVLFSAFSGSGVFALSRKEARLPPRPSRAQRSSSRTVVSIKQIESVPVRCVQVDSDDRLFLCGESMIPTHNSTLLSGISLYLLVADNEPAAECFGAATSREQAGIVYKQMAELVRASPYLTSRLEIIDSRKTIACVPTNSFWKVISSDSNRAEGLNIHGLCYDELHSAKDRKLWDAIRYGGISRSQSLVLAITTAGYDRSSICYEQHEHALKVMQDPSVDPQFFAFIAAATAEDDYRDPAVWQAANPSYGVTMDEESFKADVREAEASSHKLSSFLRYRLNVWVSGTDKFVNLTNWDKCKGMSGRLDSSRIWHAGLDLAQTWDVNAFVAVSKAHDGTYDVLCRFWIPEDNAATRKEDVPYVQWAKNPERTGLVLTPGDNVDYEFIKRDILDFCKQRTVRKIATDPHNSHYLVQQLQGEGLNVIGFSQTFASMNTPTRTLDGLIANGRLRTNDNAPLNWMAGNCTVKTNADGYIKIAKPSAMSPMRVDGMVALAMAIGLAEDAAASPAPAPPEIIVL